VKIPINLASQPFRHNRGLLLGSGLLAVIMIGTLVMLISLTKVDRRNKRDSLKQLAVVQQQMRDLQRDQAEVDRDLRQPKNAAVLERSVLLNQILVRKGISWTRIFGDLEKILPYNVRVLQIRPTLDSRNQVYLQMVLGADHTPELDGFLATLEASDVFGATTLTTTQPPSQTDPLVRYTVSVIYAQKL
jgi:type IV pilus assembly protein PilN